MLFYPVYILLWISSLIGAFLLLTPPASAIEVEVMSLKLVFYFPIYDSAICKSIYKSRFLNHGFRRGIRWCNVACKNLGRGSWRCTKIAVRVIFRVRHSRRWWQHTIERRMWRWRVRKKRMMSYINFSFYGKIIDKGLI